MKKNLALIATDLHIRPQHIEAAKLLLNRILEEIDKNQPEYLFLLGDIFHYKDRLFASCLSVFLDFLEEATSKCTVISLVGNHDWGIPYSVHSLDSFRHIKNFIIVDDIFKLDDNNGFISYCREKERFDELKQKLGPCKRLFGHLDINEFKIGSGWEEVNAYSLPTDFKEYEQVFSGHYHLAQERKLENGTEIVYVGTGYTTDFGESDQFKRFILLNIETGDYSSIDTGMTLHKTIRIKANEEFPILPEEASQGVEYRVIVSGTREQIELVKKPKDYPAQVVLQFVSQDSVRVDLLVTDSRKEVLSKYVDHEINQSFGGDKSGFDKGKLIKIGENILHKYS